MQSHSMSLTCNTISPTSLHHSSQSILGYMQCTDMEIQNIFDILSFVHAVCMLQYIIRSTCMIMIGIHLCMMIALQ